MQEPQELPAEYVAGRFYVCPVTEDGKLLRLFTDTGGGLFLRESAVARLDLPTESVRLDEKAAMVVSLPRFTPESSIPSISTRDDPRWPELKGRLFVRSDDTGHFEGDGLLGQEWFGGRVWTFDYPGQRLLLGSLLDAPSVSANGVATLGFPVTSEGHRGSHFPSIEATIDGETHAFLFDTGATLRLSETALAELGGPRELATCFITTSLFQQWREGHPDWRIIENADLSVSGEPIIEVPLVNVAGLEAGPVWFTRRPDRNFHEFMSSMMDRQVEGALGGSLFQYFVVTVDYPRAVATFSLQSNDR